MRLLVPVPKESMEFFKAQNPNLVQKRVQVKGNGKTFYRMQWVVPGQAGGTGHASEKQLDLFGGDVPMKEPEKVKKFYVTMMRDGRPEAAWLAGPYDTHEEALSRVEEVRGHANKADPRSVFDSFGTASYEAEKGKHRNGVLNNMMTSSEKPVWTPLWQRVDRSNDPEGEIAREAFSARGRSSNAVFELMKNVAAHDVRFSESGVMAKYKALIEAEKRATEEISSPYADPEAVEVHEKDGVETKLMKYTEGPHAGKFGVRIRDNDAEKNVGITVFPTEAMARDYYRESVGMVEPAAAPKRLEDTSEDGHYNADSARDGLKMAVDGKPYKLVATVKGFRVYAGDGKFTMNQATGFDSKSKILAEFDYGRKPPTIGRMRELIRDQVAKGERLYLTPSKAPVIPVGRREAEGQLHIYSEDELSNMINTLVTNLATYKAKRGENGKVYADGLARLAAIRGEAERRTPMVGIKVVGRRAGA